MDSHVLENVFIKASSVMRTIDSDPIIESEILTG